MFSTSTEGRKAAWTENIFRSESFRETDSERCTRVGVMTSTHASVRCSILVFTDIRGVCTLARTVFGRGSVDHSLEPGPSRARYIPRDMLLLTTTAFPSTRRQEQPLAREGPGSRLSRSVRLTRQRSFCMAPRRAPSRVATQCFHVQFAKKSNTSLKRCF